MNAIKKKCCTRKIAKIVVICITGAIVVFAIGYLIYKLFAKKTDDYDFYDDLDNYYEDFNLEKSGEITEKDFEK